MKPKRVLVVDDSESTRALLVRTLRRAGFEVVEACDGIEGAVTALRERPTVVVTDLEMPTMDGYQLLRFIKGDPTTAHAPVIILTSHSEAPSLFWGMQTGADAYLTKDHQPEELIATVSRLADQAASPAAVAPATLERPIDVVARVAHQLDARLMQATLVATLLERGMKAAGLHDACRISLSTVSEVADLYLLAAGVVEPESVTLHMLLPVALSLETVDRAANALLARLEVPAGAVIDAVVSGSRDGDLSVDPAGLISYELPLRDASGVLALLPRSPGPYRSLSEPLVQAITRHLALVLDNARLAQRLRELSVCDGLTRQLNHRAIHDRLTEEFERARRYGHPLSIVICDLDHFKRINDDHGHLAGDAVLRAAARALSNCLRGTDAFGRYGGEEFLAVLAETDLPAAQLAATRLLLALADHPISLPAGGRVTVTGSFGVASRAELATDAPVDALVSLADARLYDAKSAGRNCVRP